MSGGRKFATSAARARRHLRRRDARRFEQAVDELFAESDWSRAECRAYLLDPLNETLCDDCGWSMGMVCPECERGCGCETRCSGWRHSEYFDDDDPDSRDEFECEGCGAGHEYHCVCYDRLEGELDEQPERDWYQEWKDDQMQPAQEEPDCDYWEGVSSDA